MDHGLLSTVRQKLQQLPELAVIGVYTFASPQRQYPLCLINLDSLWTFYPGVPLLEKERIDFTVTTILKESSKRLTYGQRILQTINGQTFSLKDNYKAHIRLGKWEHQTRDRLFSINQHFEALIFQ